MRNVEISYERSIELFKYDSITGNLFWKKSTSNRVKIGSKVGNVFGTRVKYVQTSVDGRKMLVHRIVWLIHNRKMPKKEISHVDGNGINNRIENLDDVSSSENNMNLSKRKDNTSGSTGITWHKGAKQWLVQAQVGGKYIYGGLFRSLKKAKQKRKKINEDLGFHPNHGRSK